MSAHLDSTAPHIANASSWKEDLVDWGAHLMPIDGHSSNAGKLLWKGDGDGLPEAGIWECSPGSWQLQLPRDELCHFVSGRASYSRDTGEVIEVTAGTVVHFLEGWSGQVTVHDTIRAIYMLR